MFVNSIYFLGSCSRLDELARPLLVAAMRHKINDLARMAEHQLISILSLKNIAEILLLSHKYKANILKKEALKFAVQNAAELTLSSDWDNLSIKNPELMVEFTKLLASKAN